ncbi:MAG TPA: trans-aconitate 2-methyltransferase [Polyangiaceae bacterium]|nr:trans-aconitate 2-methyltransferase [Polyangiaceae bacterium]
MPTWDEIQYLKFADERTRPARELLARVPLAAAQRVLDLGCGPGNSTALLRERYPDAHLTGVDSSAEMLARARREDSTIEWIQADASHFVPDRSLDLSFSNATLQWLPDHERLVPKLLAQVRPGGVLAFQVPCNFAEPSHRLMRELRGPWADRVAALGRRRPVGEAAFYYDLLAPHAQSVDIWQTRYEHVLADAAAIVEWVKGTGLRPFLEVLSAAERPQYLEAYTQAIAAAYPARADGKRLFSFPRLFVVALR